MWQEDLQGGGGMAHEAGAKGTTDGATRLVLDAARRWGADLAGAAALGETGVKARFGWAVAIAVRLSDAVIDDVRRGPTLTYAYHYLVVNRLLDDIALRVTGVIQGQGFRALPVPASQIADRSGQAGIFPHKTAATLAGLGWLGRNALLVTPQWGPRLRLATVLTDLPLAAGRPLPAFAAPLAASGGAPAPAAPGPAHPCAGCAACVKACPAGALTGGAFAPGDDRAAIVDAERCAAWIDARDAAIGAEVCGVCVAVCPAGCRGGSSRQGRE